MKVEKVPPVKVNDPITWLAINTFECPLGRIAPEKCEEMRKRPTARDVMEGRAAPGSPLKLHCCENCTEWEKLALEVYEKRKKYLAEGGNNMPNPGLPKEIRKKARELYEAGKSLNEIAKELGVGKSTLSDWKNKENWERREEVCKQKKPPEKKAEMKVLIDFSKVPELLKILKKRAEEELRSLEMQILWELKKVLEMEKEAARDVVRKA
jgi:transposase